MNSGQATSKRSTSMSPQTTEEAGANEPRSTEKTPSQIKSDTPNAGSGMKRQGGNGCLEASMVGVRKLGLHHWQFFCSWDTLRLQDACIKLLLASSVCLVSMYLMDRSAVGRVCSELLQPTRCTSAKAIDCRQIPVLVLSRRVFFLTLGCFVCSCRLWQVRPSQMFCRFSSDLLVSQP